MANILRELIVKFTVKGDKKAADAQDKLKKGAKDGKKALDQEERSASKLQSTLNRIQLGVGFLAFSQAAGMAINLIESLSSTFVGFVESAIHSASEAELSEKRLQVALESTGDSSRASLEEMLKYASAVEATSTVSDDAATAAMALSLSFGATKKQAMDITKAAADMSAATGNSFEESAMTLTNSLAGRIRELAIMFPELKKMSEAQLRAGAAITLSQKRFSGAAVKNLNTYTGAVGQLANAWDNAKEAIGGPISAALVPVLRQAGELIKKLTPDFGRLGERIATTFHIIRTSFAQAFGLDTGTGQKFIRNIGDFLVHVARLLQDFFFFLAGDRSYIGQRLGIQLDKDNPLGNLGKLLVMGFEKMVEFVIDKIPAIIGAISMAASTLIVQVIESILGKLNKFFTDDLPETIAQLASNFKGDMLTFYVKVKQNIDSQSMHARIRLPNSSAYAEMPGQQTINRVDNRQFSVVQDVSISTNQPAPALQRQINMAKPIFNIPYF
jgi:hypothetical protein